MPTRIVHLCAAYENARVYGTLFKGLGAAGIQQAIFAPQASGKREGWQPADQGIPLYQGPPVSLLDRAVWNRRVQRASQAMQEIVPMMGVRVLHAHTWFADGGVAQAVARVAGIPYIVAVRNTDLNLHWRWRPHLRRWALKVASEAKAVVLLSPAYKERLLTLVGASFAGDLARKCVVIPNPLEESWFGPLARRNTGDATLRVLFVGDSSRNKNLVGLLAAVEHMARTQSVRIGVVGPPRTMVLHYAANLSRMGVVVDAIGRVDDDEVLRKLYADYDVCAVPAFTETFGLALAEALSQGTPVVHGIGEGLDGYFGGGAVAFAVDPRKATEIAKGVARACEPHPQRHLRCREAALEFRLSSVVERYQRLYESVASRADV